MTKQPIIPVILSGGAGSRLWPVSRESHPKPFILLPDGVSLLQKTFLRASTLPNLTEIITITNKEYYLKHKTAYQQVIAKAKNPASLSFILEPCARNTAPAVLQAALKVLADHGPDALLLILPADHLIEDTNAFADSTEAAFAIAATGKLVTFGITPTTAETGFGYIACGEPYTSYSHVFHALGFVEKPNRVTAEAYLQSKRYLWNAGMFCFNVAIILQEFERYAPELFAASRECSRVSKPHSHDAAVFELEPNAFAACENISIDYALMEKAKDIAVIACNYHWQDIGTWEAYKKLYPCDDNGNTILGDSILIDSKDNFIYSENRVVASIGINDLAIIDTPDALLIAHRDRTQEVKQVVQSLKSKAHESYLNHRTTIRPWGSYTVLEEGPSFKIKRIVVNPQASLSLQLHHHRSEHWVVVEGIANAINGDKHFELKPNESIFVPMGTPHRLSNPGDTDLIIIEVQTGNYLGEDDIVRLRDIYGRIEAEGTSLDIEQVKWAKGTTPTAAF